MLDTWGYYLISSLKEVCELGILTPFPGEDTKASLLLVTCLKIIESQIELNTFWPQSLAYFTIEFCLWPNWVFHFSAKYCGMDTLKGSLYFQIL